MKKSDEELTCSAFAQELQALCEKHGVILEHEDGHGSAYLRLPVIGEAPGLQIYLEERFRDASGRWVGGKPR